jgi:hypothetical protein
MSVGARLRIAAGGLGGTINSTADAYPSTVTVLDNLTVTWGRESVVSHPDPSTVTAAIALVDTVPDWLRVGALATVTAVAQSEEHQRSYMELLPWRAHVGTGWHQQVTPDPPGATAGHRPVFDLAGADSQTEWFIAPGVQPPSYVSEPTQWAANARTIAGVPVTFTITVPRLSGATVRVVPLTYQRPGGPYTPAPDTAIELSPATYQADTDEYTGTWTPEESGLYVGAHLRIQLHTAPAWMAIPRERTWTAVPGTWADAGRRATVTNIRVVGTSGQATMRDVEVFTGRVQSLRVDWSDTLGRPIARITAVDKLADLNGTRIGDAPWREESWKLRARRILAQALGPADTMEGGADTWLGTMRPRDVDHRSAGELMRNTLGSVAATIYPISWNRWRVIPFIYKGSDQSIIIPGRAILRAGVQVGTDASANISTIRVTYFSVTYDENKKVKDVIERTTARNIAPTNDVPPRSVNVKTELARLVGKYMSANQWVVSGLSVVHDQISEDALMRLLSAAERIAQQVLLVGLPKWFPAAKMHGIVIGGSLTMRGGRWTPTLRVANTPL